jgi:hypothetical protein
MTLVLLRDAVLPAAALRSLAFFEFFTEEVRVFDFALAVLEFVVFALEETLREPLKAALLEFLRGATFFRELLLVLPGFFLVAMSQVYHCGPAQFTFMADGRRHRSLSRFRGNPFASRTADIDEFNYPWLPVQIEAGNCNW